MPKSLSLDTREGNPVIIEALEKNIIRIYDRNNMASGYKTKSKKRVAILVTIITLLGSFSVCLPNGERASD